MCVHFDANIILYGLESCPLTKSDLQSIDFVINRLLMKLFKTSDMHSLLLNTVNAVFPLTCRVICGKSEPERLNVNSVNFVSMYALVKFLFVYPSVYLFGCLFIRFFYSLITMLL